LLPERFIMLASIIVETYNTKILTARKTGR